MKKISRRICLCLITVIVLLMVAFSAVYFTRFQSMASMKKLTSYETGYNLYEMDIKYDYGFDDMIERDIQSDQEFFDALIAETLPLLPVHYTLPQFGCSAFGVIDTEGDVLTGRNFDFADSSALLIHTSPKDGYESIGMAALTMLSANDADAGLKQKMSCLAAPYMCMDGMNEKGVTISVLMLDSDAVHHQTEKPSITTTMAIRLVLDKAATTEEAIELLKQYDMYSSIGRDYHFYINDASGDGRVVEYDCMDEERQMVVTPVRTVTNFFEIYKDKALPNQKNGIYGHGRERYDIIESILSDYEGNITPEVAWNALQSASQPPKEGELTSNTQWSVVYNNTDLTAEIAIRRDWNQVFYFSIKNNQ